MSKTLDIVIIGSGPNGLSAGIYLARQGLEVLIIEQSDKVGGGMRTSDLTMEGYRHDICSGIHNMGYMSPYFKELQLEKYGLEWVFPKASVAHPLDDEEAVILYKSIDKTAENLGKDGSEYKSIIGNFAERADDLFEDVLKPLGLPKHPLLLAKFGIRGLCSAESFTQRHFKEKRAKALFAGCTAHSILPLDKYFTAAVGILFLTSGHAVDWPIAKYGSQSIADALLKCFYEAGGKIQLSSKIDIWHQLPEARAYVFDTDPTQMINIAVDHLPERYKRRIRKFNYGPGVFKMDYALSAPIPWKDPRCLNASTVHIGGTIAEIAQSENDAWHGRHCKYPYVLLGQQSLFDKSRAPAGNHTCWAYCHVPYGSTRDMSTVIENQIERFAPGFKETIIARHQMNSDSFYRYNPNYLGGTIAGGASDITQLFSRPIASFDPYSTPNHRIFICSASTPPGGGVHGMCGYYAARSVMKKMKN